MKQILLLTFLLYSHKLFAQYPVDSSVKAEFFKTLNNLPLKFVKEMQAQNPSGLALVYRVTVDTLNKKDLKNEDISVNIYNINSVTGEVDSMPGEAGKEETTKNQSYPMLCNCSLKNNSLIITVSPFLFPDFSITAKLYRNKIEVFYSEFKPGEKVLQIDLQAKKVSAIKIPASVNFFSLDKKPLNMPEQLFGKMSISTSGYYDYENAEEFKHGYIYKRMNLQFYFHCSIKSSDKN